VGGRGFLEEEARKLVEPFSEKEIKDTLDEIKSSSTPGPNGLPDSFFKSFWDQVKEPVVEMFGKFYRGEFNISRLNYGLISFIPKITEANTTINQFRPICLIR
jgi:hypothetical protein